MDVQTNGNGSSTTYGYDSRGRVTSIGHRNGATPTITFGYHYGTDGNLDQCVEAQSGGNTWTTAYVHDKADRLTSEVRTGGTGVNWSYQYAYDGNGNRTSVTRNGVVKTYTQAGLNDQFDAGEGYAFQGYDNDGNPGTINASGSFTYLVYDEAGRVRSSSGGTVATYRYDGDGRRVERVMGGVTTRFLYDGDTLVAELNGSNAVQLYRLPGVGFVRGGQQRYELSNLQGSAAAVNDSAAAFKGFTEYDAYGQEVYAEGTDRGDLRFGSKHGYVNDDLSGMPLLGARYYIPQLGRFLTQDPIGHEGGLNLYAYCGDSPLLKFDPDGKQERMAASQSFLVGLGDGVTFGGTKFVRKWLGNLITYDGVSIGDANQAVDYDSGVYVTGRLGGEVIGTYLTGSAAGWVWRGARGAMGLGNAARLGGAGTRASHLLRIESGNVHLIPGVRQTAVNVLHFHLSLFKTVPRLQRLSGLAHLHLPYQAWPAIQGMRGAGALYERLHF